MKEARRVVVTGLGTVNPVGLTVDETWARVLAGKSGIETIANFDASEYTSRVAGEVKNFDYKTYYSDKTANKAKRLDKFVHFAIAATQEALKDSALILDEEDRERIGVIMGTGIGGMNINTREYGVYYKKSHKRLSPFFIPTMIGNMAAGIVSIEHGLKGPNFSVQSACASANHALGSAYYIIKSGEADVIVSGGTESIVEPTTVAGFCNMKALSTRYNDEPHTSSRPFDVGRDGFVIAEGAGIFILESYEHAKNRGAKIYGELKSVGMSGDANDMVAPCADGEGAYLAMNAALRQAKLSPDAIGYINCHGTSTQLGDLAETLAISKLLNHDFSHTKIGSTKSMTGHMIGAASAIEGIFSLLALYHGKIPPNVNLFNLDEKITIPESAFPKEATDQPMTASLSNSFGFGGHNSCAVFTAI